MTISNIIFTYMNKISCTFSSFLSKAALLPNFGSLLSVTDFIIRNYENEYLPKTEQHKRIVFTFLFTSIIEFISSFVQPIDFQIVYIHDYQPPHYYEWCNYRNRDIYYSFSLVYYVIIF